jgi:uncharacterized protein YrrD
MLEDLHIGSPVAASDGDHVGTLARVIVDGTSDRVLGLVVDPGLIASGNLLVPGGWERPRERVVDLKLVESADHAGVRLTCDKAAFEELPLFEREQYTDVDVAANLAATDRPDWQRFQRGDLINYLAASFGLGAAPYLPPVEVTHEEPPTAGAINKGASVWRLEPHERIGAVEDVLMDERSQRVGALVLRRDLLGHRVLLPATAIVSVEDGVVHARLTDAELEALEPYHPAG